METWCYNVFDVFLLGISARKLVVEWDIHGMWVKSHTSMEIAEIHGGNEQEYRDANGEMKRNEVNGYVLPTI